MIAEALAILRAIPSQMFAAASLNEVTQFWLTLAEDSPSKLAR